MNIRQYNHRDFPAILEIYARSKLDELAYENKAFRFLPLNEDCRRLGQFKESDIYVYDDNGVVAYGALFGSEIRSLFVHPKARGKGLGRKLFEFLLAKAPGQPSLYVVKTNTPAKKLYVKYGFTETGELETDYNGVPVIASKMQRLTCSEQS